MFSYRPIRAWSCAGTSRDNTDRAYAVRHEVSLRRRRHGGRRPSRARCPTSPRCGSRAPAPTRRAAARASCESPRRPIRLRPLARGRRSDQRWYHETRVPRGPRPRVRAPDAADGRLVLTHRIVRRAADRAARHGHRRAVAPAAASSKQAWADGVFDRFLTRARCAERRVRPGAARHHRRARRGEVSETTAERQGHHDRRCSGGQQARRRRSCSTALAALTADDARDGARDARLGRLRLVRSRCPRWNR